MNLSAALKLVLTILFVGRGRIDPSFRARAGVCLVAGPVPVRVKSETFRSSLRGEFVPLAMFDLGESRTEGLAIDLENRPDRLPLKSGSSSDA